MTLKDISHGSPVIIWIAAAFFAILTIVFLSGHGANLIAGYNTSSKEEQAKYDKKKLCRVLGFGMLAITLLVIVMGVFEAVLPASFAYVTLGVILTDCLIMIVLSNTICKKKGE